MKKSACLTPGEFELMAILWPMAEASVRQVWERVDPERGLAYTTVMTVLEKMFRKGVMSRRKKGKAYLYSPCLGRDQALQGILDHLCSAYFHGSYSELAGFVNRHAPGSPKPGDPAKPESPSTESTQK
jgi:predicted transcriptional regulator